MIRLRPWTWKRVVCLNLFYRVDTRDDGLITGQMLSMSWLNVGCFPHSSDSILIVSTEVGGSSSQLEFSFS